MISTKQTIRIHKVPERSAGQVDSGFTKLMQEYTEYQRPRIVLDCSNIWNVDIPTIQLLLSYLEEAMRFNGDVRLSAMRPEVESSLHRSGVSRLFEIYRTTEMASNSFQTRTSSMAPIAHGTHSLEGESEYAA